MRTETCLFARYLHEPPQRARTHTFEPSTTDIVSYLLMTGAMLVMVWYENYLFFSIFSYVLMHAHYSLARTHTQYIYIRLQPLHLIHTQNIRQRYIHVALWPWPGLRESVPRWINDFGTNFTMLHDSCVNASNTIKVSSVWQVIFGSKSLGQFHLI